MQRLDPELLVHILHYTSASFVTPAHLRRLNSLKAVNTTWSSAIRRVLRQHAPTRAMLELFRQDCEHDFILTLPLACRINPYASSHGLTVLSVLDEFGILNRCVHAVIHDLCIEAEPCAQNNDACPCTWHFEEVLGDAHDPALCLASLRIRHITLEVAGEKFTCLQHAMQTEFTPTEIAHATDRGLCSTDALLLACMHLGRTFHRAWLSINLLPVLHSLQNTHGGTILQFIGSQKNA